MCLTVTGKCHEPLNLFAVQASEKEMMVSHEGEALTEARGRLCKWSVSSGERGIFTNVSSMPATDKTEMSLPWPVCLLYSMPVQAPLPWGEERRRKEEAEGSFCSLFRLSLCVWWQPLFRRRGMEMCMMKWRVLWCLYDGRHFQCLGFLPGEWFVIFSWWWWHSQWKPVGNIDKLWKWWWRDRGRAIYYCW